MLIDIPLCPVPGETVQISAMEQSLAADALDFLLEPFQPLREKVMAITGLGLEIDDESLPGSLRRIRVPGPGGTAGLSVLAAGHPGGQRVIFVHGSPGLGEEWSRFLASVPKGRFYLAPDRPGFGESGDQPVTDLRAQAEAIAPLLGAEPQPPVVLVGYSYGGPVALQLAADRPDRVGGLLLIGAAADPGLEVSHPLQELAALDFFQRMLPSELANSNAELLSLREGLERLAPDLSHLNIATTIIQGTRDTLVPPANADYLKSRLPAEPGPATVMIEGADHFLPWTHHDLMAWVLNCLTTAAAAQSPEVASPAK